MANVSITLSQTPPPSTEAIKLAEAYGTDGGSAHVVRDSQNIKRFLAMAPLPHVHGCATLRMGRSSGLVAVDIDSPSTDDEDPSEFYARFRESLEGTLKQITAGGNAHYIFKMPDNPLCANTLWNVDGKAVDYIADNVSILAEPCHLSGGEYKWEGGFDRERAAEMPRELQDYICRPRA